jgi:hypothetical protein
LGAGSPHAVNINAEPIASRMRVRIAMSSRAAIIAAR